MLAKPGNQPQNVSMQPAGGTSLDPMAEAPSPFPMSDKPTKRKARMSSQPLIMAVVLGVSAASIFAMRQYGARSGMVFADIVVDYQQEDAEKARTYERIMADLARVQTPLDVALGEFGKSPFMLDSSTTVTSTDGLPGGGPTEAEMAAIERKKQEENRRAEVRSIASGLQLNIVMGSLARIDGQNYREGDRVNDLFTVTKVDGRAVTLTAEGMTFVLTMEEHSKQVKKTPAKVAPKPPTRPR